MTPDAAARGHHAYRVLIAGGGVAALETLLALRDLAGHRIAVTMLAPEREFLYRPVTVGEAYDRSESRSYNLAEIVAERPADQFIWSSLGRVYAKEHVAVTTEGAALPYDALVVATGAVAVDPLPGALTFRGRPDVPDLRAVIDDLVAGRANSVAIAIASEWIWPLPAYELALLTASTLREHGSAAKVTLVTPEAEPLSLFGPAAAAALTPMLARQTVELLTSSRPALVRPGLLVLAGGGEVHADVVISLPALEGPRLAGVPFDEHGFISVDPFGRARTCTDVYAAGDVTAYPLKQGGLATQQADAVAQTLAAEAGAPVEPEPFRPVLRGLLMSGGAPLYLRCEPERLNGERTVAFAPPPVTTDTHDISAAAGQPLWWPPAKIAGRYLAPYLATAHNRQLASTALRDRHPTTGQERSEDEIREALELALLLADCDARWGDFGSALEALDAAELLIGSLPPDYQAKRREWTAALRRQ